MVTQATEKPTKIPREQLRQMLLASRTEIEIALRDVELHDCIDGLREMGVSGRLLTDTLGYHPQARCYWQSEPFSERERIYLTIRNFYHKLKLVKEPS